MRWYLPLCSQKTKRKIFIGKNYSKKNWIKILFFFGGFWIKFGSKNVFFNPIFKYSTIYKKNVVDTICVLFSNKSRNGCNRIIHECDKKIINHFAKKKVLGCSKMPKIAHLNTLKLFFGKIFYYFLGTFMKNVFYN